MFKESVEEIVVQVADSRSNGLIITSGQQYSGRASTLFGPTKYPNLGFLIQSVNTLLGTESVDNVSISFIDMYHEVVKDFGINLEANLNVRESDITFNDDLEDEEMGLVNELSEDMDGLPIIPIKN
jgi:hypothetical protein